MKKVFLLLAFLGVLNVVNAQTFSDYQAFVEGRQTVKSVVDTVNVTPFAQPKGAWYISLATTWYNTPGRLCDKTSPAIEIGKQYGTISIGLDVGQLNLSSIKGRDTSIYFEIRPNLNIFQQGRFTNTVTIGLGVAPFATMCMISEFSSGIEYEYTNNIHFNINFGQYYFSGKSCAYSPQFIGINIIYYL